MTHSLTSFAVVVLLCAQSLEAQWVKVNRPNTNCFVVNGSNLYAGTGNGVLRSTDNGTSWVNVGLAETAIMFLLASGSNFFAGTYGGGVFRSVDNGGSWTATNSGLTSNIIVALAVSDSDLFAGSGDKGVFHSTNSGESWLNLGLSKINISSLVVSGTKLIVGTDDGIHRFNKRGTDWIFIIENQLYHRINSLVTTPTSLLAGTTHGVFLSRNNGESWFSLGLTNNIVWRLAVNDSVFLAGTLNDGVFCFKSKGVGWVNIGLEKTMILSLAIFGSDLFAATSSGVWRRPLSEEILTK